MVAHDTAAVSQESLLRQQLIGQLCAALITQTPPPGGDRERAPWHRDLVAEASLIADLVLNDAGDEVPRLMLPATVSSCLKASVRGRPDPVWILGADAAGGALGDSWDSETPHLLVAGSARSGKSTVINSALCQALHNNHPDDLAVWLVGGGNRFHAYRDVAHVERYLDISDRQTTAQDVANLLSDAISEVGSRLALMSSHPNQPKNLTESAALATNLDDASLPSKRLLIVIEGGSLYLDPIAYREGATGRYLSILRNINRIARESRCAGVHLLLSMEHTTKENVPATVKVSSRRIGLRTASAMASRAVVDQPGLEGVAAPGTGLYDRGEGAGPTPFRGLWLGVPERTAIIARLPRRPDSPEMASVAA